MTQGEPANDRDDYVIMECPFSFDELIEAIRANGGEVECGLLTDDGAFIIQAND